MAALAPLAPVRLGAPDSPVADRGADLRGHQVLGRYGSPIGYVEEEFADHEGQVRFLLVHDDGIAGIGACGYLLPVDIITRIGSDYIYISKTREFVTCGPHYNPSDGVDGRVWSDMYAYYGCRPYWEHKRH
jgi:hypothetical protein